MLATFIGTVGLIGLGAIGGASALLFLGFRPPNAQARALARELRALREHIAAIRRGVGE